MCFSVKQSKFLSLDNYVAVNFFFVFHTDLSAEMLRGHEGLGAILLCTDMIIEGNKYTGSLPTSIPINETGLNTPVSFPYAFWE